MVKLFKELWQLVPEAIYSHLFLSDIQLLNLKENGSIENVQVRKACGYFIMKHKPGNSKRIYNLSFSLTK